MASAAPSWDFTITSAMPSSIPAEIWLNVAQFIPKHELRGMLGINSTFFRLAMDAKYREAAVSLIDEAAFKKHFREPPAARRVRKLRVSLAPYEYTHWTAEDIQSLTCTITHLVNVRELFVELPWPPGDDLTPFLPFLTTAWKTFGSTLQKLHILGPLKSFPSLIPITHGLTAVHHLCVDLNEFAGGPNAVQRAMLSLELARLINKLGPTLRHLTLKSQSGYDDLPLFGDLDRMRHLERVEVNIHGVHPDRVFSSRGLIGFLRRHAATLRHLLWNGPFITQTHFTTWGESGLNYGDETAQRAVAWLRNFGLDKIFSRLLTLRLRAPDDDYCFSLMLRCIEHSADSLTSLELYAASFLSTKQVETLVGVFARCQTPPLRELHFDAEILSPELILAVHMLPCLQKLGINFGFLRGQNALLGNAFPVNKAEWALAIHDFADAMRKTDISDWSLRDVRIQMDVDHRDEEVKLMRVLAEQIPSVKTFDGIDKECYAHVAS